MNGLACDGVTPLQDQQAEEEQVEVSVDESGPGATPNLDIETT